MAKPNNTVKKRIILLMIIFTIIIIGLVVRVAFIQIVNGEWYRQKAYEQHNRDREITPKRGTIYDRNGNELAVSATVEKVVISPQEIKKSGKSKDYIAKTLAHFLDLDEEYVAKKVNRNSRYEVVKKRVEKDVTDKIRKWRQQENIVGVFLDEDTKRYYPNGTLAAHVLGFVGDDNQGLNGIEFIAEKYLKGSPGKILSEVDASGRAVPFNEEKRIEPTNGLNVVLTIDETIQYFVQRALEQAIEENKVLNGAGAIVMDPNTGEILALVSKPDFDCNAPKKAPQGYDETTWKGNTNEDIKILSETVWRNKIVTDTYEPGSTFKAITSVAGLEEGVITPMTPVNDATITVQGRRIRCWKANKHGEETFKEGVYNSCNPVFVKVAQSLGIDKFYEYVSAFGFMEKTGITLPGEASSIFHKKPKEIDMAVASFGQRFQITPIQLITAYSAIANGGNLVKPKLIKELTDQDGHVVKTFETEFIRSVISKKTANTMKEILEGVVTYGGGAKAYVKGFRVGGKTGTSETTENGHYIASFSGIAPVDNPKICVLVVLDNPTGESYYGGRIAAPVAGRIIEDVLTYLEVERKYTQKDLEMMETEVEVPDVCGKTVEEATRILQQSELYIRVEDDVKSGIIEKQVPQQGEKAIKKSTVLVYAKEDVNKEEVLE